MPGTKGNRKTEVSVKGGDNSRSETNVYAHSFENKNRTQPGLSEVAGQQIGLGSL